MGRLKIVLILVLLGAAAVTGRVADTMPKDPVGTTFSMDRGHNAVDLAASGGATSTDDVTKAVHAGAVVASQDDRLSVTRLGSGMGGRKMLGEAARLPSDSELLTTVTGMAAQAAVLEAVDTKAHIGTGKGHIATQHATIADGYDTWKTVSGVDKRRLGDKSANMDPSVMNALATSSVQAAVRAAADGSITPARAALAGRESGMISSVEKASDTMYHLAAGEYPEGPMTHAGTTVPPL